VVGVSRLTDLLSRHAAHHQPLDLTLLMAVIRQEKWTGSLTLHYRHGQPKLLEAGRPIQVEVESAALVEPSADTPRGSPPLTNALARRTV
jgi:hypothetical protein